MKVQNRNFVFFRSFLWATFCILFVATPWFWSKHIQIKIEICALPVWRGISDIEKDDNWDCLCKYFASQFLVDFILHNYAFFFRIPKDRYCNRHWICHHGIHRIFCQTHPHSHQQHHCRIVDFLLLSLFFVSFFFKQ